MKAGRWLDDKGPKGPLTLSIACTLFAGIETLLLPVDRVGLAPLFAACLSVGFGFLLVNTVTQRLVGDVVRPEFRSNAFTFLSMTTAASGLVTPVFAGHLIESLGFSSFYLWCSVLPVLLFLLLLTPWFKVLLRPLKKRRAASTARGKASELLGDKALRAVLIASVLVSVGWEVGNLLIPVYCTSVKLSPSDIGWVLGSFSTASFVVRLLTPLLLKVLREWYMIALTFFLSATAFALFPLFENFWLLTATSFLLGLGLGAALPNMMSLVYRLSPAGRIGEAIGLRLHDDEHEQGHLPRCHGRARKRDRGGLVSAGARDSALRRLCLRARKRQGRDRRLRRGRAPRSGTARLTAASFLISEIFVYRTQRSAQETPIGITRAFCSNRRVQLLPISPFVDFAPYNVVNLAAGRDCFSAAFFRVSFL